MPLQLVNLDDKTFEELVTEAVKIIPRQTQDWTNHNRSDPGITLIELFAWLAEMQQYQINKIGPANTLKYLKLLGERPRPSGPSGGYVSFEIVDAGPPSPTGYCAPGDPVPASEDRAIRFVACGAKLAAGNMVFETTEDITVLPGQLLRVVTSSEIGLRDNSQRNAGTGMSFAAFGDTAESGSQFYLGFNKNFIAGKTVNLMFYLFEDYETPRGSHGDEKPDITPSAKLAWEYYGAGDRWAPLSLAADETIMLSQSGRVQFQAPGDMQARQLHPFPEMLFWLRCRVEEKGYELPPRLISIVPNTVPIRQTDTLSEVISFSGSGERRQSYLATSFLALAANNEVQVQDERGAWRTWSNVDADDAPENDLKYSLEKNGFAGVVTLTFGRGTAPVPAGKNNIRLISFSGSFKELRLLGASSGLPYQSFALEKLPVVGETLLLQAGSPCWEAPAEGKPAEMYFAYADWTQVDDFDCSGPSDTHYVLDAARGEIRFGDGIHGAIPPASPDGRRNIQFLIYQVGGGAAGNLKAGAISQFGQAFYRSDTLSVRNLAALAGGRDAEAIEEARARVRAALQVPWRAVTNDDYVYLAKHTPGLRVRRAHPIPLSDLTPEPRSGEGSPALMSCGKQQAGSGGLRQAVVSVIVVPESTLPAPRPSQGFLATVCRHLNRHRLLTACVCPVEPTYVTVTVQARVTPKPGAVGGDTLGRSIQDALNAFLDPLKGGPDEEGWPFGRTVYRSDIYQQIEGVEGVACVDALSLTCSSEGTRVNGNITIPTHSLVTPGAHQIDVRAAPAGCPGKGGAA